MDINLNTIEHIFKNLCDEAKPIIEFSKKLEEKNINLNTLNAEEKGILIKPLRQKLQELTSWEESKKNFEDGTNKMYDRIISKLIEVDIEVIEYCTGITLSSNSSIVDKARLVDKALKEVICTIEILEDSLGSLEMGSDESEKETFLICIDKLKETVLFVEGKFGETEKDNSFFASSTKRELKAAKRLWYYSTISDLFLFIPVIRKLAVGLIRRIVEIGHDTNAMQSIGITLDEVIILLGLDPDFAEKRTETEYVSYGGHEIEIKEFSFSHCVFKEVDNVVVSIEYDEYADVSLEDRLAAKVIEFKY